nr:retrotransposon protein Ty1-copia subclass [Tanacetum cinerariifolium]
MKDVFVSVENDLDETLKQIELLKDRLLEASLAEDIKNLVITSCVEIRNKDLHESEIISKESKDVSNESKTVDAVCNDAFEVTQFEMSRDVLTVGSTMRIPLLYRGEYFQWVERFINYLEEQTDGEAMINSIKNEASLSFADEKISEAEGYEYMIRYSAYFDNDKQHRKQIADQQVLYDKMSVQLVELDKHVRDLKNTVLEKEFKISELEECVRNKDLEIKKYFERLNVCENKLHKMGQTNQTVHIIMPSKDNLYNVRKGIGFENLSYFEKAKDLRPTLYDEKVIGLGYTLLFLTHSNEALEIEKFKRSRENKIKFAYDYGNLNASYVNENINFEDDYFQEIINPDFEKIDSPFQQTSSLKPYVPNVILEKIIIDLEDEVYVSPISMSKSSCDFKNVEIKLKRKRHLDTFSSVRRPRHRDVIWKNKGSFNTSNVGLSAISVSNLNKNIKRYSHKDLLVCNNSHLGETRSDFICNDSMNVSYDSRMNDLLDDNNFFIFDNVNIRISLVSKMPFRKKPCDSMHVRSKSNMIKSLPRTVHKWLLKLQLLAEPVAKSFPRIVQICLLIIDSGCSKHMMGNRALLMNFVEKFLETVRFGNNDFAVIAGYGDVVIGLPKMKFEKDHLFSACEQGKIYQKHHKSNTAFASNKPLYLLYMDLCGPMRVQSINEKKYVLVVVDDYSRYTWVFFLHSKDEASEVIISFIKITQANLQLHVQRVRTDNGTEFKNKTLAKFFDEVGIT